MRKIIGSLVITILFITSCQQKENIDNKIPQDLEGKKEFLKKKKLELFKLENEITKLENEIDSLDPGLRKHTKVTAQKVELSDFNKYSEIQGVVLADEVTKVTTEIPGRVLNIYVKNGDKVRRGQLLAKIDVETIKKQLEEMEKSYELAKDVFERQSRLWKKNIGSEIQYLTAKNNKERLEKGIESLKLQLNKSNIYAPSSGIIDRKQIEEGELASPGFPLMQILNTATMKIVADVPENYLSAVHKNDPVEVKFPSLNMEAKGKITLIGSTINPTNRTFSIEVKFKNHKNLLKANQLAIVMLTEAHVPSAIVISDDLIQYEINGKPYVMVAIQDNGKIKAKKKYIVKGDEYDGKTLIT
ncbi:MAG TPA: efflux RND transporter periplasmic adaptor subunit, partial [Bacteroidetes bacterium]|nr:efflux RND transporter periplasmic adaptor subunit [Bacteroidota bacterium]